MSSLHSEPEPAQVARGEKPERAEDNHAMPLDPELTEPPEWSTQADRRTTRDKLAAGLRGLKIAMRGDSSFFVHAYRAVFIILAATLLNVGPFAWCLLGLSGALVLVAELNHSAIDTLARAVGDPEERALKASREIAAAGVLLAVVTTGAVVTTVFLLKLGDLLSWW